MPPKNCLEKIDMQKPKDFFLDSDFLRAFSEMDLTTIDAVFNFSTGRNLNKLNLAQHRSRMEFETASPKATLFLKRYDNPPKMTQLKNWLVHRARAATMAYDMNPAKKLGDLGINTPKTICYGSEWAGLFEKRSFIITEKIPNAHSLEKELSECFALPDLRDKKHFIESIALFVRKFHDTGFRHRDLYLCHIFYSDNGEFSLIDLQRCFRPKFFARRFRLKDIAQLYYSSPGRVISKTDRLRFYLQYSGKNTLSKRDKVFISKLKAKADKMARHDIKHNRTAPFAS